jgi:hypothetical protein
VAAHETTPIVVRAERLTDKKTPIHNFLWRGSVKGGTADGVLWIIARRRSSLIHMRTTQLTCGFLAVFCGSTKPPFWLIPGETVVRRVVGCRCFPLMELSVNSCLRCVIRGHVQRVV